MMMRKSGGVFFSTRQLLRALSPSNHRTSWAGLLISSWAVEIVFLLDMV